jgi:hypothetical protein
MDNAIEENFRNLLNVMYDRKRVFLNADAIATSFLSVLQKDNTDTYTFAFMGKESQGKFVGAALDAVFGEGAEGRCGANAAACIMSAAKDAAEKRSVAEMLLRSELEGLLMAPKGMDEKKFADFCRELASDFAVFIGGKTSGGISEFVEMKGSHETFASFFLMSKRFGEFLEKHKLDDSYDVYKPLVAALENVRQAVLDMKSVDAKKAFPQPIAIIGKPNDAAIFVRPGDAPKGTVKR